MREITAAVLERAAAARPYSTSRPISVCQLELESPGPGEVLVKIEAASVCHSDLSTVDGSRIRPLPMVIGHEVAGRVLELGDGIDDLRVEDRVVITFMPRCGSCSACSGTGQEPCAAGKGANGRGELMGGGTRLRRAGEPVMHHLGVSGFATHAVVDRSCLVPVPSDVPADVAAVIGCAVLTGGGAILNVARLVPGMRVVVVGVGGVGLAAIITALSQPGIEVAAIDADRGKHEVALRAGASVAVTPSEAIKTGLKGDVVIEAVGTVRGFETAVASTAAGGVTVAVGLPEPSQAAQISPFSLVADGRSIVGSYLGSSVPARDIPIFVEMWREGRLNVEALITSRIALSAINEAMDDLADGKALRQVIMF